MSVDTRLEFDRLPAVAPAYARALTKRGGRLPEGGTIPDIEADVGEVSVDPSNLAAYRRVCGFAGGDALPVTYPHILAFPIHMAVLTHRRFPLKLLGLVHMRNAITQHRRIGADERLGLNVSVGGHRQVHNGIEFDLVTRVRDERGDVAWESSSTMLSRGGGTGKGRKKGGDEPAVESGRYATWEAPADIGRRYARAAGDYNPIHLSALTAKLFGFPRAIAHGMWSKARTAAEIEDELTSDAYRLEVSFRRPVLLPGSLMLKYRPDEDGIAFVLMDPDGNTTHMQGAANYL